MKTFLIKIIKNPYVINLLIMIGVSCGLLFGTLRWLDVYTRHNEAVVVPDVKGLRMPEAITFFEGVGVRHRVIDSVFSKQVAPGAVVELIPPAGAKVKEGRIVFVTINALSVQMAPIPEVQDLSLRQAYALLKAAGFEAVTVEYVPGDFKDLVMCVEKNGEILPNGEKSTLSTPLTLVVSNGLDRLTAEDSLTMELIDSIIPLDIPIEKLENADESWF